MKKTLIASAIALTTITTSTNTSANIAIANMTFFENGGNYAAEGSVNDDGSMGAFNSIDTFLGQPWTATQETAVIDNSNGITWAGTNEWGAWDYATDIANMNNNQVAIGAFFNWNNNNDMPLLAVFDCVATAGNCTGQFIGANGYVFGGMQTGVFPDQNPVFSGSGTLVASVVPVPAAAWLMGSGLIGLIGVARHRRVA